MATEDSSLLLINAYMPSGSTPGDEEYTDTLDQEIILKYQKACRVMIDGDKNASVDRMRPIDITLQNFIEENTLTVFSQKKDTFIHHSQKFISRIDSFLADERLKALVTHTRTEDTSPIDTSDHTLITIMLRKQKAEVKKIISRTRWNQCNNEIYRYEIKTALRRK